MTHNYLVIGSKMKDILVEAGFMDNRGRWLIDAFDNTRSDTLTHIEKVHFICKGKPFISKYK